MTPVDDTEVEGNQILVVMVTAGAGYTVGSPSADTVTIIDDDGVAAEFFADSEVTSNGTVVSGSWADTLTADDVHEVIEEELYGGSKRSRLVHEWTFSDVAGGTSFTVKAHRSNGVDEFLFEYSTDGLTWLPMLTVSNTDPSAAAETFNFPTAVSGTVLVRVTDTDRSRPEGTADTISIDQISIS